MIPPLNEEEYKALVPQWAQELDRKDCPLVPGLPVYCTLYGPKHGLDYERGVVVDFYPCDDTCSVRRDHWLTGHVHVKTPNGGDCYSLAANYVPDMETEEGKAHVEKWRNK